MRLIFVLLLFVVWEKEGFAQPPKATWLSFQVDSKMDTSKLPRLTEEEKALDIKNKKQQEELHRKIRESSMRSKKTADAKLQNQQDDILKDQLKELHSAMDSVAGEERDTVFTKSSGANEYLPDSVKEEMKMDMMEVEKRLKDNAASITITKRSSGSDTLEGIINYTTICQPWLINDTLSIVSGVGFFAGYGIVIQITEKSFAASFGVNGDGAEDFKRSMSDSIFADHIEVSTTNARLTLLQNPQLQEGKVVCGYLEADFVPFYEKKNRVERLAVQTYHGKVFFKCTVGRNMKCDDCSLFTPH